MQRSIAHLRIAPAWVRSCTVRFTARRLSASVLSPEPFPGIVCRDLHDASSPPHDVRRERTFNALVNSLSQETPDSSEVWACYVDCTNNIDHHDIPLEIHQNVLRNCVPDPSVLRPTAASGMRDDAPPRAPYVYEARLKTVIRNIRLVGETPTLDDYHYILTQFAAVGHYTGSIQVYNELKHVHKLQPTDRTVALCLRSIAHRLSLPMYRTQRQRTMADAMSSCRKLLEDFKSLDAPLTSVVLDLTIRILKETGDEGVFSQIMKMGYGIDLDNLDSTIAPSDGQTILPFSTAALNTTLDMLGRFGNTSRLVQAFEVLTQPLPPQASHLYSMDFDDEDDFGVVNPAVTPPHHSPHASPNTTTYNILLRHLSRAGHTTFARHYLLQASRLDRTADRTLRAQLYHTPEDVAPVQLAINREMILSLLGLANRSKDLTLMRFVGVITRRAYKRKTQDIHHYTQLEERHLHSSTPSSSSDEHPSPSERSSENSDNDASSNEPPTPSKRFKLSIHLAVLRKDLNDISTFYVDEYLPAYARLNQRIKERLGRRVRNDKDVYLSTEGQRTKVLPESWTGIVNYKMEKGVAIDAPGSADSGSRTGAKGPMGGNWSRGLATISAARRCDFVPLIPPIGYFDPSYRRSRTQRTLESRHEGR
ncbi:hypothetical protein PISMIDRAFT_670551 [Pisolithus microcarpus 441]|uniref:Uncharacterized protein n=1 Tax=Pisolithus microcarpus 441 TaxID=765257 RepID=A0A0D0A7W8_9AGAM|nr:hypothetical protein PISMIDRAFT_670551 [Pisolithus microcarpus 441]